MFNTVEDMPTTKPARTFSVVGIAIVIVLVVIAAYVMLNRVSPTAEGDISAIWLYQPLPGQMADGSTPPSNGLIMLVPVQVRNVSSKPLSIMDLSAVVHVGDTDYKSYAAPETISTRFSSTIPTSRPTVSPSSSATPKSRPEANPRAWSSSTSLSLKISGATPQPLTSTSPSTPLHTSCTSPGPPSRLTEPSPPSRPRSYPRPHPKRLRQPTPDRPVKPPLRCHPERSTRDRGPQRACSWRGWGKLRSRRTCFSSGLSPLCVGGNDPTYSLYPSRRPSPLDSRQSSISLVVLKACSGLTSGSPTPSTASRTFAYRAR